MYLLLQVYSALMKVSEDAAYWMTTNWKVLLMEVESFVVLGILEAWVSWVGLDSYIYSALVMIVRLAFVEVYARCLIWVDSLLFHSLSLCILCSMLDVLLMTGY